MEIIPTSHAARAKPYFDILDEVGVRVDTQLERKGLPVAMLEDPSLVMPAHLVGEFIRENAQREGIGDIAFRGALRETFSTLEPEIQNYLNQSGTLKHVLDRYFRLARSYVSYRNFFMFEHEETVYLVSHARSRVIKGDWMRVSDWSQIMVMIGILRHLLGASFQPTRIFLQAHGEVSQLAQAHFPNSAITLGHWTTAITIPRSVLAARVPEYRLCHTNQVLDLDEAHDFLPKMKVLLAPYLDAPTFGIETAAEIAGLSVRSFQRRLANLGFTYRELIEQTRFQVATKMLSDPDSCVIDVAFQTGYRDPSNFTRMFRRVSGVSPTEFQKSLIV